MSFEAPSANECGGKSRKCARCRTRAQPSSFRPGQRTCVNCRESDRARYVRDSERIKGVKKEYYLRKKVELSPIEWRARQLRTTLRSITLGWLQEQWETQAGRCALTGRQLDWKTLEVDHIIPRSRGGSDELSNLRFVCRDANRSKQQMLDEEFIELCREVVARTAQ